ncbi:hypothetical protein BEL05_06495 [Shewanella colwelliana]|uniref:Uncharacterized protein n=1 Tax=Shewanella colwelliana TaxID=23 RepID=A0A1E5IR83_SHECO|nr:hypothetical protein BEL05_06495 [Shewanella colwelliana]
MITIGFIIALEDLQKMSNLSKLTAKRSLAASLAMREGFAMDVFCHGWIFITRSVKFINSVVISRVMMRLDSATLLGWICCILSQLICKTIQHRDEIY